MERNNVGNKPIPPEVKWKDLPARLPEEAHRVMEVLMDIYAGEVYESIKNHPEESAFLPDISPATIGQARTALIDLWNAGLVRFCDDEEEGTMGLEVWLPIGTWKMVFVRGQMEG